MQHHWGCTSIYWPLSCPFRSVQIIEGSRAKNYSTNLYAANLAKIHWPITWNQFAVMSDTIGQGLNRTNGRMGIRLLIIQRLKVRRSGWVGKIVQLESLRFYHFPTNEQEDSIPAVSLKVASRAQKPLPHILKLIENKW